MGRATPRARAWICLAALVASGCAGPPGHSPMPPREVLSYVLQPGDILEIKVFNLPELEQQVPVRPDGRISFAPIGDLAVAGLELKEVDATLTRALSRHFKNPRVTVFVRWFGSRNVYVGGEVENPGLVPLHDGMTALMAIIRAGDFVDTAQRTKVVVLRDSGVGGPSVLTLNAKRILNEGARDLTLQPFDVVFVPKSKIARVNLAVEQYIKRVIPLNLVASGSFTYIDGDNDVVNP